MFWCSLDEIKFALKKKPTTNTLYSSLLIILSLLFLATGLTVFEITKKRPEDKRKRHLNDDPSNIDGYLGPWGKFVDEKTVMKPNEVGLYILNIILYNAEEIVYMTL